MNNEQDLQEKIDQYNNLIDQWNNKYGDKCNGIKLNRSGFNNTRSEKIKQFLLSKDFSEKQKLKHNNDVIGDFANNSTTTYKNRLTQSELALLIVKKGKKLLKEY